MVSEFYMAAENGSGNKNAKGGFPAVATQPERRPRQNLDALLQLMSSADWFQFYDERRMVGKLTKTTASVLHGYHNRPYAEVTAFASPMSQSQSKAAPRPPDATAGVPSTAQPERFSIYDHLQELGS